VEGSEAEASGWAEEGSEAAGSEEEGLGSAAAAAALGAAGTEVEGSGWAEEGWAEESSEEEGSEVAGLGWAAAGSEVEGSSWAGSEAGSGAALRHLVEWRAALAAGVGYRADWRAGRNAHGSRGRCEGRARFAGVAVYGAAAAERGWRGCGGAAGDGGGDAAAAEAAADAEAALRPESVAGRSGGEGSAESRCVVHRPGGRAGKGCSPGGERLSSRLRSWAHRARGCLAAQYGAAGLSP